ncbi:hypothetical protein LCGC14_1379400 [marine sediment metagenome]|uniref:Uncharacterized protein n=1 Tax=marine sediment metagenome TaxID=412755 RepID=A0A0F9K386_9ZZZZ
MDLEELQNALDKHDRGETITAAQCNTFVEAARLVADPMDELWFCKAHGYAIDRFDGLTPKECLYVGRPGDCEPVAALVIAAALTPGDTNG